MEGGNDGGMGGRSSAWKHLQDERDRRRKAIRKARLKHQQLIEQATKARTQAEKRAARGHAGERRRQTELAHEAGSQEAATRTQEVEARVEALQTLLVSELHTQPHIDFSALRAACQPEPFDPGPYGVAEPEPRWEQYEPEPPVFFGRRRYERDLAAAQADFAEAGKAHRRYEAERKRQLADARTAYEAYVAETRRQAQRIDRLARDFDAGVPEAVEEYFGNVLAQSVYPEGFPDRYRVAYRTEPRELVVEYDLPTNAVIPRVRGYKYVKTRREIDELGRADRDVRALYNAVISQVVLRVMRECFAVRAQTVVDSVVVNGIVDGREAATGKQVRRCVLSVGASRADFDDLVLEHLDPSACLKRLRAIMSPHPDDLEAVEPLVEFDKAKYRFTDPVDALAGLDSRPDLLKMDWYRFENLIRQLFAAMGMEVEITQSSRDDGIDAVAYVKTDAIHRAEYIIQAKRYKRIVSAESVRALAGVVEEKRATRGFLVTTSWFGAASRAFATANNRLQLIDGGELKHLLAEHLNLDVRIDLPKR